MTPRKSCTQNV